MPYITTEWDYGLKTEVFVVKGDKGYTHTTDTLLSEVNSRNTSQIEYFTAEFNVDVVRDLSTSKVVIYDNDDAIPVIIDDNQVEMIDWQQGDQPKTFKVMLGYDVKHKIYAKYLGNKKGLASKSQTIELFEKMPTLYSTEIVRTSSVSSFDTGSPIELPISFNTTKVFSSSATKTVDLYVDGEFIFDYDITIPSGETDGTGTLILNNGLDNGLHQIEIRFEGDEENESFYLPFQISVGYMFSLIENSPVIAMTKTGILDYNYVKYKVTDYFDTPVSGATIKLKEVTLEESEELGGTVYATTTTDEEGVANFNSITELPALFKAEWEKIPFDPTAPVVQSQELAYSSEPVRLPVIKVSDIHMSAEKIIADGYSPTINISLLDYEWVHNSKTDLKDIPVLFSNGSDVSGLFYTNYDGVASIPYVGANRGDTLLSADASYAMTQYVSIEDVTQYWDSQTVSKNKDYRTLAPNFYELTTGFRFEVKENNTLCGIGLGDGEIYEGDWIVSFEVVSASSKINVLAGDWFNEEHEQWENLIISPQLTLKKGQLVTIKYTKTNPSNGILKLELPQNVTSSIQCYSKGEPFIGIRAGTAKSQLTIDKLKFRRL